VKEGVMRNTWFSRREISRRLFNGALALTLLVTTISVGPAITPAAAATNFTFGYVIVFQNGTTVSGVTNEGQANTAFVPNVGGSDPANPAAGMLIHMSCSDNFGLDLEPSDPEYGYGTAGQPNNPEDSGWRVADYYFYRLGTNGGRCGNPGLLEPATLTLVKTVVNTGGGTLTQDNFQASIDGTDVDWDTPTDLEPGTYTAAETTQPGYTASAWGGDCDAQGNVTLTAGQNATCTITNTYTPPDPEPATLTLVKTVVNTGGGTLTQDNFQASIDGTDVDWDTPTDLEPGTYTAAETTQPGYTASAWGGDCDAQGNVTLTAGQNATCTITNTYTPPDPEPATLTLVKTVVNTGGGTLTQDNFQASIDGTDVDWDTPTDLEPGTYTAAETTQPGYTASAWGGDCDAQGNVTLTAGQNATCTITNTYIEIPSLSINKLVDDLNGGWADTVTYPFGQDSVTWQVTITNESSRPVLALSLNDVVAPSCEAELDSALELAGWWMDGSGGFLPPAESITIECTEDLAPGTPATNTAIATGVDEFGRSVEPVQDSARVLRVAASGTIGDTVWSDENGNGIQDNGEKGIAGARLRLTLPDGSTLETTTNANGLYLFSALPAGTYKVELIMSSLPTPSEGNLKLTTPGLFNVTLGEGQSFLDADFGVVATLPDTGLSSDQFAVVGIALVMFGATVLAVTRKREDGPGIEGV
jgi:LPXTG-motif cell wall-anchored protein